jgi:hypothetical protein
MSKYLHPLDLLAQFCLFSGAFLPPVCNLLIFNGLPLKMSRQRAYGPTPAAWEHYELSIQYSLIQGYQFGWMEVAVFVTEAWIEFQFGNGGPVGAGF